MSAGPHLELAIKADFVTKALLQLVIAKITQVVKEATQEQFLILVQIDAPRQELDFVEPEFVWSYAAANLVKNTKIAYVVTGRPLPADTGVIEDVSRNCGVTLKCFSDKEQAIAWLQNGDLPVRSQPEIGRGKSLSRRKSTREVQGFAPVSVPHIARTPRLPH